DDWAFYQAKTVRVTVIKTQADTLEAMQDNANARISRQIAALRAEQKRLDSDPKTQEGRKEMGLRAKISETRRDHALAAYHNFEYGSAAFQLAIVLASAAVITEVSTLAFVAGGLGLLGLALCSLGWFMPTFLPL